MALDELGEAGKTGMVGMVLAIAACGPRLELALGTGGNAPGVVALAGPTPRSELVVAAVDLLLRGAGVERTAITGVAASRGPGSFTGVRVGLATAQGLATALGIPAHGFSSLLAQAARTDAPECLAVQPARRGHVYAQAFSRRNGSLEPSEEPRIVTLASLAGSSLPVVAPVGGETPEGTPLAPAPRTTGEALLVLLASETVHDPATLVPVYLEPSPTTPPSRTALSWPPSHKGS